MDGTARLRSQRRRSRLVLLALVIALALGLTGQWWARRSAAGPIVATIPLRLDPRSEVDVLLDGRRSRVILVNAGTIQAFDTRTGTRLYRVQTGTAYEQALGGPLPAIDERTGWVYVPNLVDDAVTVLDTRGRVWTILHVGHRPDAIALDAPARRLVVASTADWTLTTLDTHSGRPVHTAILAVGDRPTQLTTDPQVAHAFVAGYGGEVALVVVRTGLVVRQVVPDHSHIVTDLAVDARAGRVLGLVEARPDVVILNARTGALVRRVAVGQDPTSIAVDSRTDRAFVADAGTGTIYVLGTYRGDSVRTIPVGPEPLVAVDVRHRRVITATDSGLVVLDARSGAPLERLPLDVDADALLVDEHTGHVLVVSVGATYYLPSPWAWLPRSLRRWLPFLPRSHRRIRVIPSVLRILDDTRL